MMRWWRSHSVRVRLTLWYVAAMVVVLAVYAVGVYTFVSRSVSEALDERLRADFFWAAATVDEGPDGLVMPVPQIDLLLEEEAPWVQVWSADGSELLFSNAEAMRRPMPEPRSSPPASEDAIVSFPTAGAPIRVMSGRSYVCPCVEDPQTGALIGKRRVIGAGRPIGRGDAAAAARSAADSRARPAAGGRGRRAGRLRPGAPRAGADRADDRRARDDHRRAPERSSAGGNPENEMGRLASVFNETLGRLEASFDQMRRFTADVSHELRTPLTAIRSVGEVGLRGHRDEAAYRGIIGSMLEEVDRLARLVDRLLTLSRAETRQATLSRDAVDLSSLADDVVSHLSVLAEEKRQTLTIDRQASPVVAADRLVLRQALINLVDNAIKFTPAAGQIRIRISRDAARRGGGRDRLGAGHLERGARAHLRSLLSRERSGRGRNRAGLSLAKGAVEALGGH